MLSALKEITKMMKVEKNKSQMQTAVLREVYTREVIFKPIPKR